MEPLEQYKLVPVRQIEVEGEWTHVAFSPGLYATVTARPGKREFAKQNFTTILTYWNLEKVGDGA